MDSNIIKIQHSARFHALCQDLNDLIDEIRQYMPEACLYLSAGGLNLMRGPSHDYNAQPLHENVIDSVNIPNFYGGDW